MQKKLLSVLFRFRLDKIRLSFFILSIIFWFSTVVFSLINYAGINLIPQLSFIFWIGAMFFLMLSFIPQKLNYGLFQKYIHSRIFLVLVFMTFVYAGIHVLYFSHAPWNTFGLFDDAAWDIYFAINHVKSDVPFQAAYFDPRGNISREVLFHYYVTVFFILFGYNLLSFTISLIILSYITVVFTVLTVYMLLRSSVAGFFAGICIMFFPLHFLQTFMGHRYAITPPLLALSLYFFVRTTKRGSMFSAVLCGLFAALTTAGAVTGKQYIYGLITAFLLYIVFRPSLRNRYAVYLFAGWLLGFIVGITPLVLYIYQSPALYSVREASLIKDFIQAFRDGGIKGIKPHADWLWEVFIAPYSSRRQFLLTYPVIPFAYLPFIFWGSVVSLTKKRYELVVLAVVPIAGAFVAGAFDFRLLHAVPIWVILGVLGFSDIWKHSVLRKSYFTVGLRVLLVAVCGLGFIPSIQYINRIATDPNSEYLLPHSDVAVSRIVADIAAGVTSPTIELKKDEFKPVRQSSKYTDVLFCPRSAYAIAHVYLRPYDETKILSLCAGGIQILKTPEEIWNESRIAIQKYKPQGKALTIIWEESERTVPVLNSLRNIPIPGRKQSVSYDIEGTRIQLFMIIIDAPYIEEFQYNVAMILPLR